MKKFRVVFALSEEEYLAIKNITMEMYKLKQISRPTMTELFKKAILINAKNAVEKLKNNVL